MTDVIISDTNQSVVSVDSPNGALSVADTVESTVLVLGEQGPQGIQGVQGVPGPQGEQGVPGLPGASGDLSFIYPAIGPISGHRIVTLTSGGVQYASSDAAADAQRVLGMSTNAAGDGGEVGVKKFGEITEPSWSWDTQLPVYLGLNGQLTQVPPSNPTNAFSMVVGYPITPTSLFVNIGIPITLI